MVNCVFAGTDIPLRTSRSYCIESVVHSFFSNYMMWFLWKLTHFLTLTQLYCTQHVPVCLWVCCCTSESGAERWRWRGGGKDPLTRGWRAAALGCHPLSGCFQSTNKIRGEKGKGLGRESTGSVSEVIIDSHTALSSACTSAAARCTWCWDCSPAQK